MIFSFIFLSIFYKKYVLIRNHKSCFCLTIIKVSQTDKQKMLVISLEDEFSNFSLTSILGVRDHFEPPKLVIMNSSRSIVK